MEVVFRVIGALFLAIPLLIKGTFTLNKDALKTCAGCFGALFDQIASLKRKLPSLQTIRNDAASARARQYRRQRKTPRA